MKHITPSRQSPIHRRGSGRPTGNGRGRIADTTTPNNGSSEAHRPSTGLAGSFSPPARRRGPSTGGGINNCARAAGKKQQDLSNFASPHKTTVTRTAAPWAHVTTSSSSPNLQSVIPRQRVGSTRQAPSLVSAAVFYTSSPSTISARGTPRNDNITMTGQTMPRQGGSTSASPKELNNAGGASRSGAGASALYVSGVLPSQDTYWKNGVQPAAQINGSPLLNCSGTTLPHRTTTTTTSWHQSSENDDGGADRSTATPSAVNGTLNTSAVTSSTKVSSTVGNSPTKLASPHPAPAPSSSTLVKGGSAAATQPGKRPTENMGTPRRVSMQPSAKTNTSTASTSPVPQKDLDTSPQSSPPLRKKPQQKPPESGAEGGGQQSFSTPERIASPHTSSMKMAIVGTPIATGGAASLAKTPVKSSSPCPALKGAERGHKQCDVTLSCDMANASLTTNTSATTTRPSTPQRHHTHHSPVPNQRAAAMLSQMLSMARPMAPVVHVRIRPVLPSFGETNHQRHVYLLDHENVMITGRWSGINTGNTATSVVMHNLLSPTTDYGAAKRIGTDTRGGSSGGTGRSHGDLLSASSAVPANSSNSEWRDPKSASSFKKGAVAASLPVVCGGSSLTFPSPAALYGGSASFLTNASESPPALHDIMTNSTSVETKRHQSRSSSNAALVSGRPLSQSLPSTAPAISSFHHPRTTSWLSQGSEDAVVGSRLSVVSHSTSPQSGLALGGTSASLTSAVSTPRVRPRLAAFTALTEDAPLSATTTPRGLNTSNAALGTEGTNKERCGRRRSAFMQQSVSLSTITAPGSRATTRKNSMVSGVSAASLQKGRRSAGGGRLLTSRSALGASVSVSAISMLASFKAETKSPTATAADLQRPRSPLARDASTAATATNPSGTKGTEQHYSFEFVHDEEATQADVFEESVLRFADEALLAQNVAIICYGPTGSGKTYSMMGTQTQVSTVGPTTGEAAAVEAAAKSLKKAFSASHGAATKSGTKVGSPRPTLVKTSNGTTGHRSTDNNWATSPVDAKRRLADDSVAPGTTQGDSSNHRNRSLGMVDDDEDEGETWPQLGSSWQYGYTDRFMKRAVAVTNNNADGTGGYGDGEGWHHNGRAGSESTGSVMTSATMADMGILPRLVHTLLERRGEAITIRRESGGEGGGAASATARSAPNSPQPTPRATNAQKTTSFSLTLRDLTFYGIELYMDEIRDLLDPGKRPIQMVSDTGGLAALCQRINEARDYRINGSRGGASQVCVTSPRAGGGMAITSLADLRRAYRLAHSNRVTSKHAQNDTSSRSHAIFLLQLDFDFVESHAKPSTPSPPPSQRRHDGIAGAATETVTDIPVETAQPVHSYVAMVDLAGCERVKQTRVEGMALREAQYINKSLSALSSVVLSLHRNNAHVPYRDSKLTRLLRPCLEGGRVLTLVHVAPCSSTETLNTLKFADQIRHTHIPTHALTPTSSKHRELLDVFADLIDPMQGLWEAQVRHAQLQLNRLCADLRLAYFSRAVGAVTRRSMAGRALSPGSARSDALSEVSALTDVDDGTSLPAGDTSLEEGPPPLASDATDKEKRSFALHSLLHNLMGPIHQHERTSMRDAILAIWRRKEHKITSHELQLQQRIEKLQSIVEKLTASNAKLANENRTPLPRDPYALELNRQLREIADQMSETMKEQAALMTLTTALRQRLLNQDTLEVTVDEQLRNVQHRTTQVLQTLSAAAAAHPPGVMPAVTPFNSSSPREPTLPTGALLPATISMETDDDPELRDIAHQQISLARELAALRLETACFEIGTNMWEGLWARAMRKEIITALEVEVFAMERILLDRRALSLMLMDDNGDDEVKMKEGGKDEGTTDPLAGDLSTLSERSTNRADEKFSSHAAVATGQTLSSSTTAHLSTSTAPSGNLESAMRSALWARLDTYLRGKEHHDNGGEALSSDAGTAAAATAVAVIGSPIDNPRTPPPPSSRYDGTDLTQTATPESSEPRSVEGQRARGTAALYARPGSPRSHASQKSTEDTMPNPLTILAMAHDVAVRRKALQEQHPQSTSTALPPRRTEVTLPTGVVAASLLPLTISGTYGDEQAMQEACLQLLLRDGIPCEACCMGNSGNHVLQHYVLPGTATAPMAEEADMSEKTLAASDTVAATNASSSTAAAVRYTVKTPTPTPHLGPGSVKNASCTTRFGRLRLVRMPRRPNCYVLEFVYTHQGLPMSPRMQAALTGKPEASLMPTPRKTNLEQMVDSLPSVHGVAGRGGTRTQGLLKEHRLFAIPLHEPSLHLHMHVLEEGILNMTTPVAATWTAPADATDATSTGSAGPGVQAASSALCVARRVEPGSQIVLEVHGLPSTASTHRTPVTVAATDAKKKPPANTSTEQKAAGVAGKSGKGTAVPDKADDLKRYSQLATGANKTALKMTATLHTKTEPFTSSALATAGWNDLVLAKRLSSGGELMLPSSCILSNKGCCSLVLRFPCPFFTSMTRTESVEAIVGALCGILRPSLTQPEARLSTRFSFRSPSKKSAAGRGCRSTSPSTTSGGDHSHRKNRRSSSSNSHRYHRGSLSSSPFRDEADKAMELEVITYAHVPYSMFAAEPSTTLVKDEAAAATTATTASPSASVPVEQSASSRANAGRLSRSLSSSQSASVARSDSLDGLVGTGGGVLGHTLQSSCSTGKGNRKKAHTPSLGNASFPTAPHIDLLRTPSESNMTATTVSAADQHNGATLQVQFYWVPTPLDVEPPRSGMNPKSSGAPHFSFDGRERAAAHVQRNTATKGVRQQLRAALGILAHLSYIFVEGHPPLLETDTAESSLSNCSPHGDPRNARERPTRGVVQHLLPGCSSSNAHTASRYKDAVSVATMLRQLDTYRQRIRRLFRQQLYDAEDVLGDDAQLVGPDRGTYMRDVQTEVRQTIGLPSRTHWHATTDGGGPSLDGSPVRLDTTSNGQADMTDGDGSSAAHALLSPLNAETGPDAQVTIPEAREVCGATVPWSIWQWAYRWSQLRRLLQQPDQHVQRHINTTAAAVSVAPMDGDSVTKVDAAAVWLPVDARMSEVSAAALASHTVITPASLPPLETPVGYASSSSSSSEGYVMEGDWLKEARYAASSKRVWLPDVLSSSIPFYLESCVAGYPV